MAAASAAIVGQISFEFTFHAALSPSFEMLILGNLFQLETRSSQFFQSLEEKC